MKLRLSTAVISTMTVASIIICISCSKQNEESSSQTTTIQPDDGSCSQEQSIQPIKTLTEKKSNQQNNISISKNDAAKHVSWIHITDIAKRKLSEYFAMPGKANKPLKIITSGYG